MAATAGIRRLVEPECDGQSGVEFGEFRRVKVTAPTCEYLSGQGEDVVAVGGIVVVEALWLPDRYFGDVTVEAAGDQHAEQRREHRDRGLPGDDDDGMDRYAGDVGIPDVAALDQRPALARHAATEKLESAVMSASWSGSGRP